jgi:predicted Rossmann-fold nucleotide-binding protein
MTVILPLRVLGSLDTLLPVSSVKLERPRFGRKNFSEKKEKLDNRSTISDVRLVVVAVVEDGLADTIAAVVMGGGGGGMAAVANGRIAIVDDGSTGRIIAGFLINDKNRCRHKSSGISELSTSNSRNCRKLR